MMADNAKIVRREEAPRQPLALSLERSWSALEEEQAFGDALARLPEENASTPEESVRPPEASVRQPEENARSPEESSVRQRAVGRQSTFFGLERQWSALESLPEDTREELVGHLPPLRDVLPVPIRRVGSRLFQERRVAREHVVRSSPMLYHTESWTETLLTPREYVPPRIFVFVVVMVSLATVGTMRYPDEEADGGGIPDRLHTTMISFISLLLVFRTSEAYARWWEGRTLWGAMVNSSRNLASNAACWMHDDARATRVIVCAIAFAYATKQALRGKKLDAAEMHGLFDADEVELMNGVEHVPLLLVDEMRRSIQAELVEQKRGGGACCSWDLAVGSDIKALVDALGGCERIAKTPMPFGYLAQLRIFIREYGWWTIPLVSLCAFVMLKIEEMAVQIEHPFGLGANDLPIDTICVTIERNLLEVLRRSEHLRKRAHEPHVARAQGEGAVPGEQAEPPLVRIVPTRLKSVMNLVTHVR